MPRNLRQHMISDEQRGRLALRIAEGLREHDGADLAEQQDVAAAESSPEYCDGCGSVSKPIVAKSPIGALLCEDCAQQSPDLEIARLRLALGKIRSTIAYVKSRVPHAMSWQQGLADIEEAAHTTHETHDA